MFTLLPHGYNEMIIIIVMTSVAFIVIHCFSSLKFKNNLTKHTLNIAQKQKIWICGNGCGLCYVSVTCDSISD